MGDNTCTAKNTIYGFDLLKFILAILIISGHTALFQEYADIARIREIISSIAVPTFMAISSYLFFRKVYNVPEDKDSKPVLLKTLKRLALLFLCWYIIMLPMTYFKFFSVATIKETIFAIFFSCTFNGYWFIKALFINTCIFYFCRNGKALLFCSIISWIIYLFFSYNYVLHIIDFPYHPYYSFYYNLAYYSVGVLFAKYGDLLLSKNTNNLLLILSFVLVFFLGFQELFNPLYRFLSIPLLFILFYQMELESKPYYKTMRQMSIILYMIHFFLIWIYDIIAINIEQCSIIKFLVVSFVAISVSLLIIRNGNKPGFSWLKYLY